MQVVSLRRLEHQKVSAQKRESVFYLVPKMVVLGLIVAPIFIYLITTIYSQPKSNREPISQTSTLAANQSARRSNATNVQTPIDQKEINPFAASFLEILPPPAPNCDIEACVALTFDDGPSPGSTAKIQDALERNYVNATYFVVGNRVKGNEDLLRRINSHGDQIGNHSWSHASFMRLKPKQRKQQVTKTNDAIKAIGLPAPTIFRPPYEDFSMSMQKDIKLPVILWNVDPKDWAYDNPKKIASIVEAQIKPGAIIVLHDKPATAAATEKIVARLKDRYKFVTVSQLLGLKSNSPGVYVGR